MTHSLSSTYESSKVPVSSRPPSPLPVTQKTHPAGGCHPSACGKELAYDLPIPPVKLETTGTTAQKQLDLIDRAEIHALSIAGKLKAAGYEDLARKISECCESFTVRICRGCCDRRYLPNHCDNLICPKCQHRIASRRHKQLEWWTKLIHQPKHVVLTVRNTTHLWPEYISAVKDAFRKLRRSKLAKGWRGGCWSLEVTNEGRGWHVHLHALIDANWIDQMALSKRWGKLVGQDFAIVKVIDCRQGDYLREVAKYVAKGSELATWSASDLAKFVHAMDGQRTFGIFGSLYGVAAEWKRYVNECKLKTCTCEQCGSTEFEYMSDSERTWRDVVHGFL